MRGKQPSTRSMFIIEALFKKPIWSSQEEFDERAKIRSLFAEEPYAMSIDELTGLALRYGVRYYELPSQSRESLISAIAEAKIKKAACEKPKPSLSAEQLEKFDSLLDEFLKSGQWKCFHCWQSFTPTESQRRSTYRCPSCRSSRIVPDMDDLKRRLIEGAIVPKGDQDAQALMLADNC